MQHYNSRELKSILEANGWFVVRIKGEHWQFKHNEIKGKITVTKNLHNIKQNYSKV